MVVSLARNHLDVSLSVFFFFFFLVTLCFILKEPSSLYTPIRGFDFLWKASIQPIRFLQFPAYSRNRQDKLGPRHFLKDGRQTSDWCIAYAYRSWNFWNQTLLDNWFWFFINAGFSFPISFHAQCSMHAYKVLVFISNWLLYTVCPLRMVSVLKRSWTDSSNWYFPRDHQTLKPCFFLFFFSLEDQ